MFKKESRRVTQLALNFVMAVISIVMIIPIIWMLLTSFKPLPEIIRVPPTILPENFTFENYFAVFQKTPVVRYLINSTVTSLIITVSTLVFASMSAYAFAKLHFPLREPLFILTILKYMLPEASLVIPMYFVAWKLNLVDNLFAIVMPYMSGAFTVFLMRQVLQTFPDELIEAARLDGASEYGIFFRIVMPLCKPAIGAAAIINFLWAWNHFLWPLIVLNSEENFVMSIGLAYLQGEQARGWIQYGLIMAGATIFSIPIMIVFLAMQRKFIESMTLAYMPRRR